MTVKVAEVAPAVAVAGKTDTLAGIGSNAGEIVKGDEFERTPKLETLMPILADPTETTNEAGTVAMSSVELTNSVCRAEVTGGAGNGGVTTQSTIEPFTKFVPVTVRVNADVAHEGAVGGIAVGFVDDETDVMFGTVILNVCVVGQDETLGAGGGPLNAMTQAV